MGEQTADTGGIGVTMFCCRYERKGRPKVVTYWLCHVFMSSWCRWAGLEEAERLAPRHQAVLRGMSEALTRI